MSLPFCLVDNRNSMATDIENRALNTHNTPVQVSSLWIQTMHVPRLRVDRLECWVPLQVATTRKLDIKSLLEDRRAPRQASRHSDDPAINTCWIEYEFILNKSILSMDKNALYKPSSKRQFLDKLYPMVIYPSLVHDPSVLLFSVASVSIVSS